ncbi:MAG: glycogen/starch/alpha-glucan family phosphorylase, partial [Bythopirellula sp.]
MNKYGKAVAEQSPGAAPTTLRDSLLHQLHCTLAKDQFSATTHDYYVALVYAIREQLTPHWLQTQQRYYQEDKKRVYYLSMEYLTGRALSNSLLNLGRLEQARADLAEIGLNLDELIDAEAEAGLGNGGLGRLAACLLDSLATLGLPVYGYGIRYQYGIFQQQIDHGQQVETPDNWLRFGNPWEIARPEDLYRVQFGGDVRLLHDSQGRLQHEWVSDEDVTAAAYDVPITGCCNHTVNTLRLWSAESLNGFNLKFFNQGDYIAAVEQTSRSRSISRVLYPDDTMFSGKELRLKQEYFFVSASLQDIVRRYKKTRRTFDEFPNKVAIQLNDTHPALAIPELMRILVDLEQLGWEEAWDIAVATFGYTNHTLLPEALEEWPVHLLQRLLPRNLQIIHEINHRFLQSVKRSYPGDIDRLRRMSLINEDGEQRVRMAHLAVVGSHAVNGVSKLHSDLLRDRLFRDFDQFYPSRLRPITNGITPRRWLRLANPLLSELISEFIGDTWLHELSHLEELENHLDNPEFIERWSHVKRENKRRLARYIRAEQGIHVSVDSMFDGQVKRFHEYKRQLMNILHVVALYNRIRHGEQTDLVPRTVLISGKAAPGYAIARSIVKLLHEVLEVVNHDPLIGDQLKVVFLPNYNVSLAEKIMPAVELSQQI